MQLLSLEDVQKELKLTAKQKEGLAMFYQQVQAQREAMRVSREDIEDLSDQERQVVYAQMAQQREAMNQAVREQLKKGLQKTQMDRLDQISLQAQGTSVLEDPTMVSKLKLTDEQKKKIEESRQASRDAMRQMFQAMRTASANGGQQPSREEMSKKFEEMRAESTARAMAILTPAQQSTLDKMKGKEFEIDRSQLYGRGRGGPGSQPSSGSPGGTSPGERQQGGNGN
jgi:Spy/CpxP family protein refolding chaperone